MKTHTYSSVPLNDSDGRTTLVIPAMCLVMYEQIMTSHLVNRRCSHIKHTKRFVNHRLLTRPMHGKYLRRMKIIYSCSKNAVSPSIGLCTIATMTVCSDNGQTYRTSLTTSIKMRYAQFFSLLTVVTHKSLAHTNTRTHTRTRAHTLARRILIIICKFYYDGISVLLKQLFSITSENRLPIHYTK